MVQFEVKLFINNNNNNNNNNNSNNTNKINNDPKHYKAYWNNGRYCANNLRVEIKAASGDTSYISNWTTLESVVHEAENELLDEKFGCAIIYDGKYRVATVTKCYNDEYMSSRLTQYGEKCKRYER